MSKHETSNQFKDGLMMDVHPLQTPNTVLTDCLNGTFITYNGNEHVLQNDMGNFKLSKCKLDENYIPIGTASYGDILYIASYNPIERKFELGSYPSILQWNSVKSDDIYSLTSVIEEYSKKLEEEGNVDSYRLSWLDMSKYQRAILFGDAGLKMSPGDEYEIEESGDVEHFLEKNTYYILDASNVKHKITPKTGERSSVSWEMPGHLYVERTVMTPFEHKLSLKRASVENNSVSYTISSILTVQDDDLCNVLEDVADNLVYEISTNIYGDEKIIVSSKQLTSNSGSNNDKNLYFNCDTTIHNWLNGKKQIISEYTINIVYEDRPLYELEEDGTTRRYNSVDTTITVLPTIIESGGFTILYDNLQQSLSYVANGNNVSSAASQVFTWKKEEDNGANNWKIEFDWFNADNDKYSIYYGKFTDENLTPYSTFDDVSSVDITLSDGWDDQLLYVEIRIGPNDSSGVIDKKIGRFAFLDTSGVIEYIPQTRMDTLYSIQDVYNKVLSNIEVTLKLDNIETDGKLHFDREEFFDENVNKFNVWTENRIDHKSTQCSQEWSFKATPIRSSENLSGIWKDLLLGVELFDGDSSIPTDKFKFTQSKKYNIFIERGRCCYLPGKLQKCLWEEVEIAWDQDNSYDGSLRIHNLTYNKTSWKSQYFDNSEWPSGTNYNLWNTWWNKPIRSKLWMVTDIYAYKYKNGGNYYYISSIGTAKNKGRNGIEGYHIAGYYMGTKTPELILTKLDEIPTNLFYFVPDDCVTDKYWKLKYLYSLEKSDDEISKSVPIINISKFGEPTDDSDLAFLFNDNKNKHLVKADVEFDPNSKMEWLTNTKDKQTLKYTIDNQDMAIPKWIDIVEEVVKDLDKNDNYNYVYNRMGTLCGASEYNDKISVNCMQWSYEDGTTLDTAPNDIFPQCCICKDGSHIYFNADAAKMLNASYSRFNSYFQINDSGTIKCNVGPLKVVQYGF